jgi:hypothetical protein
MLPSSWNVRSHVRARNKAKTKCQIFADIPTGQTGRMRNDNSSRIEPQAMTALSAPHDAPPWDIGLCGSRQARLGVATVVFTSTTTPAPGALAKGPGHLAKETYSKGRQA